MKDALEFYRVKQQIAQFCGFEKSQELIEQEKIEFRYLKAKKLLQQTKEAIEFLRLGEHLQFHSMSDAQASYQRLEKNSILVGNEIRQITQNLMTADLIRQKLEKTELEELKELSQTLIDSTQIRAYINTKIDPYGEIKDNASDKLQKIRTNIKKTQTDIETKLRRFINDNRDIVMEEMIVPRNRRFCVLVVASQKNAKKGIVHGESASGLAVYFEPSNVISLNNELPLLFEKEEEALYEILKDISDKLSENVVQYKQDYETLRVLDVIMAKAKYTNAIDGIIPNLVRDSHYFYFKNAANPLIDFKTVVRNTYELKEKYNTIIITGSNTGGKTVTLKTIGLFVLMSMSGIGVSCEEAILPVYDNLLVDIGDEQSIEQSLSTFSSHIKKMVQFSDEIKPNTLILLDELGSGSDPSDSQNLAMAFLDYFREKKATIILTTHFEKIKEYGKIHEDILVSSVSFDIEKMQPTYKYIEHRSGASNALLIAKRLGVKSAIIEKANQYKEEENHNSLVETIDNEFSILEERRNEFEKQKQLFEVEKENNKAQLLKEQTLLTQKLQQQEEEFKQKLQQYELEAQEIIEKLKQEQHVAKAIVLQKELSEKVVKEEIPVVEKEIMVGDYVEIASLHYFGYVDKIQGNKYIVNVNGVKMTTKGKDLILQEKPQTKVVKKHKVSKHSTVVGEINVIGMTVSEAWSIIDKLLDNAALAKRNTFRIIHGVGSGRLREGIHKHLKNNKHVTSFILTNNLGVTEVSLKI